MCTDSTASILLGWHNIEVFGVRSAKCSFRYVHISNFWWGSLFGQFLHFPTPLIFFYYSRLAFNHCYSSFLRAIAVTEFDACAFLWVLYTAYRGVPWLFVKSASLYCSGPALLALSPEFLDVIWQLNPLAAVHEAKFNAAQILICTQPLDDYRLACFLAADPSNIPWVYYNLKTGAANSPLFSAMPYVVCPTLDFITASRQAADCFGFLLDLWDSFRTLRTKQQFESKRVRSSSSSSVFHLKLSQSFFVCFDRIYWKWRRFLTFFSFVGDFWAWSSCLAKCFGDIVLSRRSFYCRSFIYRRTHLYYPWRWALFWPWSCIDSMVTDFYVFALTAPFHSYGVVVSAVSLSTSTVVVSALHAVGFARQPAATICQQDFTRSKLAASTAKLYKARGKND